MAEHAAAQEPGPGIVVRQRVRAPVDQVWSACASARGLMNWQADQAEGEARRGGTLSLVWAAVGARVELDVVELVPYERIVLRHGASVVELSLDEQVVTLRHHGPEALGDAEGLRSSWQMALAQLAHSVERHPGRQRRVQWFLRTVRCTPEAAHLCFTEPSLLSRWLCDEGGIGAEGSEVSLLLKNGQRLGGRVLARAPGRDVALSADTCGDAMLVFRTLPAAEAPDARLLALAWSEWGRPRDSWVELRTELGRAWRRLGGILGECGTG